MLTPYTGPCTITVANTVIDSKIINCELLIRADNVTIRNSHITGGAVHGLERDGASFRIEDSWLDNGVCVNCSVDGWNFTILRTEITGSNRGAYCMHVCEIRDSWIHATALDPNGDRACLGGAGRAVRHVGAQHVGVRLARSRTTPRRSGVRPT